MEAYGLWHEVRWTEWFALISAGIYVPFEIYELIVNPHALAAVAFVVNVIIVWYLYSVLRERRSDQKLRTASDSASAEHDPQRQNNNNDGNSRE